MMLSRSRDFQAAHTLPRMPDGHKCRNLHGHTYTVTIACYGDVGADSGIVFDNSILDAELLIICGLLDHTHLNEFIENPTAENLLLWMRRHLRDRAGAGSREAGAIQRNLLWIELQEGPRSTFRLFGPAFSSLVGETNLWR